MTGVKSSNKILPSGKNVKLVIIILHREHNEVARRNFSQFSLGLPLYHPHETCSALFKKLLREMEGHYGLLWTVPIQFMIGFFPKIIFHCDLKTVFETQH